MNGRRASAPGKIVLLGEYAVLEEAPALVAAVDRFATAAVSASADSANRLIGVNLGSAELAFVHQGAVIEWHHADRGMALMQALMETLVQHGVVDASTEPFVCSVDSEEFYRQGEKIGLGSSAATAAAVALALYAWTGKQPPPQDQLFELLLSAHRRHQDHTGSGLDIAAAIRGGVFSFTRPANVSAPVIETTKWPSGLYWCVVWTGHSTSTGEYLSTLREYAAGHPNAYAQQMSRLGSISRVGIAAFDEGGIDNFLDAVHQYLYALTEFGRTTGLNILSRSHRGLAGLAELSGVVYKPCGAGGGDIGVAFAGRREPLTVFAEQVRRSGLTVLPLGLAGAATRNVGYS